MDKGFEDSLRVKSDTLSSKERKESGEPLKGKPRFSFFLYPSDPYNLLKFLRILFLDFLSALSTTTFVKGKISVGSM